MYWATACLAARRQWAYRTANLAGFVTNLFFGALRAYVLLALFGVRSSVVGVSPAAAVTYTGLSQALLSYIAIFSWWDLMRAIRTGDIATDLARPCDFFAYWLAQDVGRALAQLLVRGLPILALYALFTPFTWPPTLWHWLALPLTLTLALFISFSWRFGVSLVAFWTQDAIGVGRFAWAVSMFASGFIFPLAFFPDWLAVGLRLTPFPGMINTPIEIALGVVPVAQLGPALAWQAVWALALYLLARWLLAAGVRKLVIQGG